MDSGENGKVALQALDAAVVVALGGNLGSSRSILDQAVDRLGPAGLKVVRRSSWWRSRAWPDPSEPDYLNAVVLVETGLEPAAALAALHRVEAGLGRERGVRNASRTVDLDLIAHGRRVMAHPQLPHPRAAERLFVMGPLAEIAPDWRHPVSGETAAALAAAARVGTVAAPLRSSPARLGGGVGDRLKGGGGGS
jgi:2-amino-4-hydroxy-6-hydroxymethyldihydropteridine diphosphokinase